MSARAECREVELSLGVLLVGALDPAERRAVEDHLADCPRCTAMLAGLAPLPGLLHRLDPLSRPLARSTPDTALTAPDTALTAPDTAPAAPSLTVTLGPPELRGRLVEAARAERSRRRRRWAAGVGVAAAVLAVLLGVTVVAGLGADTGGTRTTVASATDPRTEVRADVRLVPGETGTEVGLRLTGVGPEERCRLVAVDGEGRRDVAATWVATYHGSANVTGHTSFQPGQIRRLIVITSAGRTLVHVPLHG